MVLYYSNHYLAVKVRNLANKKHIPKDSVPFSLIKSKLEGVLRLFESVLIVN